MSNAKASSNSDAVRAVRAMITAEAAEHTAQEFVEGVFKSQREHNDVMTQCALLLQESRETLRRVNRLLWAELD